MSKELLSDSVIDLFSYLLNYADFSGICKLRQESIERYSAKYSLRFLSPLRTQLHYKS